MSTPEFFDTHAHLPMLTHATQAEILQRAKEAGVQRMVTVATEEANWASSRECAERSPNVHYTLGVHPHEAGNWSTCGPKLHALFQNGVPEKCVGIGELGLDFYYDHAAKERQLEALEAQLRLAKAHGLPVIIHCREAFADLFSVIRSVGLGPAGGVMHCFTGATPDAFASLDLGLFLSFSGILTFKNAQPLRDTAKQLPLESIVIETDCPYLAPIPHRGKPNEPAYLPLTAQVLAEVRGVAIEAIAEATTRNALRLFRLT